MHVIFNPVIKFLGVRCQEQIEYIHKYSYRWRFIIILLKYYYKARSLSYLNN